MKRHAPLALALLGLHLAATSPVQATLAPRYGGELRAAVVAPDAWTEPRAAATSAERLVASAVHETLLRTDGSGILQPSLARSWTSADPKEWILALEEGLTFHDGAAITADDVARSLGVFLKGRSTAAAALGAGLTAVDALDATHVRLRFEAPASAVNLVPLASPMAIIVSSRNAGCGPFIPTMSSGREHLFVAFPGHVRGRPYLDRLRLTALPDERRLLADARSGRVQLALGAAGSALPRGVLMLLLNPLAPALEPVATRALVAASIDRDTLAQRVLDRAEPWTRLLLFAEPLAAARTPVRAGEVASPRAPLTMAVDQSLSPLISQRIVAHLTTLGLQARVQAIAPREMRDSDADLRLVLFEPEIDEPALVVAEIAAMVPGLETDAPGTVAEPDPVRRAARARAVEKQLLDSHVVIPLARLGRPLALSRFLHGFASEPRIEDLWLEP